MKTLKSREVIAANLRALMDKNKHSEGELHNRTGLSQSTIGRILKCESAATVDTLDAIANVYGLSTWQIMVAGLDISNPPVLKQLTEKEEAFYKKMREAMKVLQ